METTTATFEAGKTYTMRSPCDYNCTWTYEVMKRTPKMVTLGKGTKEIRAKIKTSYGVEYCTPLGTYSMSPALMADREAK